MEESEGDREGEDLEEDEERVGLRAGEEGERQERRDAAVQDGGADGGQGGGGAVHAALACNRNILPIAQVENATPRHRCVCVMRKGELNGEGTGNRGEQELNHYTSCLKHQKL